MLASSMAPANIVCMVVMFLLGTAALSQAAGKPLAEPVAGLPGIPSVSCHAACTLGRAEALAL